MFSTRSSGESGPCSGRGGRCRHRADRCGSRRRAVGDHQVGDGRLAGAGQAGEPQAAPACWPLIAARACRSAELVPVDVAGAAQGEVDGAAADGGVALAVDQDEAAELAVVGILLEGIGWSSASGCSRPTSFSPIRLAARCSWLFHVDAVLDLGDWAPTLRLPIFSQ